MIRKMKMPRMAKMVQGAPPARADSSMPMGLSREQEICNQFEAMEESRNDRIIKALGDRLAKTRTAPQA